MIKINIFGGIYETVCSETFAPPSLFEHPRRALGIEIIKKKVKRSLAILFIIIIVISVNHSQADHGLQLPSSLDSGTRKTISCKINA